VQQMTSAACKISRSHRFLKDRYFFMSRSVSSPISSLRRWSFWNSPPAASGTITCKHKWSTLLEVASRVLLASRTTLNPVAAIFSVSWSTATLLGAVTRTWPWFCLAKWYTSVADVTVFPVPGGPWCTQTIEQGKSEILCMLVWSGSASNPQYIGYSTKNNINAPG
jgi:hypothetical protein